MPDLDATFWAERYKMGGIGWDLGGPCPVFVELLDSERAPPPGRVAFPGCGLGHDLRLFLDRGYDAVGFDFAVVPEGLPVERLDVFELGNRYPQAFDAVVEYTCYCAIDPRRRPEYAASLHACLKPGGLLIALCFPMKEVENPPPFPIDEAEIEGILARGMAVEHLETPISSVNSRLGWERLVIARKPA